MTIRVVVADDQPLVRSGLVVLVDAAEGITVVAEAATGREAYERVCGTGADVVLMDIRMPDLDGLAATRLITEDAALVDVKVLILTTFEIDDYLYRALRAGASGFLGKGAEPHELVEAIRIVHRGEALLSPVATRSLIQHFLSGPSAIECASPGALGSLTEREREIVAFVAEGFSNDEIAARLFLSPATVKTHVNRAMAKIGARDRAQLVVAAYRSGLGPAS